MKLREGGKIGNDVYDATNRLGGWKQSGGIRQVLINEGRRVRRSFLCFFGDITASRFYLGNVCMVHSTTDHYGTATLLHFYTFSRFLVTNMQDVSFINHTTTIMLSTSTRKPTTISASLIPTPSAGQLWQLGRASLMAREVWLNRSPGTSCHWLCSVADPSDCCQRAASPGHPHLKDRKTPGIV